MRRLGWCGAGLALAALLVGAWWPSSARAVPSFARRYGTSCQTCHAVIPKLTPFGEAFRRNGYRFPGGLDEDYRREEPQLLGAEAYKDLFPKSVWPGEIPRTVPLSVIGSVNATVRPHEDDLDPRAELGASMGLNAATPLGEWLSAWGGFGVRASTSGEAEIEVERIFFVIAPLKNPKARLRIGRFEPSLMSFSSHRMLGYGPWVLTRGVGDDQFTFEPAQIGAEIDGVIAKGRLAWALGYVEGAGNDFELPGDAYARIAYKLGGMRLDGESDDDDPGLANPAPWREWGAQVGGFGYVGFPKIGQEGVASQMDQFVVVGGDVGAQLYDASVTVAYAYRRNERPLLEDPTRAISTHDAMGQFEYVVFPWFVPMLRYEYRTPADDAQHRISSGAYFLLRANVRATLLGRADLQGDGAVDGYRVDSGLVVAF